MKWYDWGKIVILAIVLVLFFGPLNRPAVENNDIVYTYTEEPEAEIGDFLAGKGTVSSPYILQDAEDLQTLRDLVNEGNAYDGVSFYQTDDIDLAGVLWEENIGDSEATPFNGNYDGGGNTILNMNVQMEDAGGLFGYLGGTVSNLTVQGVVSVKGTAGGLVGKLTNDRAFVFNSFNQAAVGGTVVGGVAGQNEDGMIIRCFNTGSLQGNVTDEIVAVDNGQLLWCTTREPLEHDVQYRCDVTADEFATQQQQFAEISAQITAQDLWPQIIPFILSGDGSAAHPYEINDLETLCVFRDLVNRGYGFNEEWVRQTANIDLDSVESWEPIGIFDSGRYFCGVYDGAGYVIENLTITGTDNAGFFGMLGGTVMNLGIESGRIEGSCVGAITSHGDGSSDLAIINCYNKADVYGAVRAGGIADNLTNGKVVNCVNYGTVEGVEAQAELVSYAGTVEHCALAENQQPYMVDLQYRDNLVSRDGEEISDFFNKELYDLATNTGYQNDCFVKWNPQDGVAQLTTERSGYRLRFLLQEILCMVVIAAVALAGACLYRKVYPRQLCLSLWEKASAFTWNQKVIVSIFGVFWSLAVLGLLLGNSELVRSFCWPDRNDSFMDLFNPLYSMHSGEITLDNFYNETTGGYPPVARFLLWEIGNFVPRVSLLQGAITSRTQSLLLFVLLVLVLFIALYQILNRRNRGGDRFLFVFIAFSSPMLFAIERGNLILVGFLLSMYFAEAYRSRSACTKHTALVALALAAAVKIYPAAYGLVLLTKKRIRDASTALFYGIVVFLTPFLFTGGFTSFMSFLGSLSSFVSVNQTYTRYWLMNYTNVIPEITQFLGLPDLPGGALRISMFVVMALLILCGIFNTALWKKLLAVTLVLILLPGVSVYYTAVFYAIPLVEVFYEQRRGSLADKLMVLCMTLAMVPPHFLFGVYGVQQEQLYIFVGVMGILLAALLIVSTLIDVVKNKRFRFWDFPEEELAADNG